MIKNIITLTILINLTKTNLSPYKKAIKTTKNAKIHKISKFQKKIILQNPEKNNIFEFSIKKKNLTKKNKFFKISKIQKKNKKNFLEINKNYDKCLKELEDTLKQIVEIIRVILKKDYSALLPIILKFGQDLFNNIECFLNSKIFLWEKKFANIFNKNNRNFLKKKILGIFDYFLNNKNLNLFINKNNIMNKINFEIFENIFGDKKQCEFDHILEAFEHFKNLVNFLKDLNLEKVFEEYKSLLVIIEDMKNC